MNKKLLNKSTNNFLIFTVIILVLSAPLFYFVSHLLYIFETDEVLIYHKNAFFEQNKDHFTVADIKAWNKYNRHVAIVPYMGIAKDTIFSEMHFEKSANENEPYRTLWTPIVIEGKKYTYTERINLVEMEGMGYSIAVMFFAIIAVFLLGIVWISKRTAAKMWEPFYDTLNQIRNFEIDKNKPPKFIATNIEEFDSLNKSIERLIEKNTAIYKGQREFVENAAHELQTPLALFQTKIDTLFQMEGLTDEQSEILSALNNDVSRLKRLNKNLLLLSKIENGASLEKQSFGLNDLVEKHFAFFTEQAQAKKITITTRFKDLITLTANPGLTEVLINNLFLNAIRHNSTGGQIVITIEANTVTFQNTGYEGPLAIDKVFNRFSKINPSAKGNGLGLAIVKKVIELNGWEIEYQFINAMHTFKVTFNSADI